jgi:hypothetical protein
VEYVKHEVISLKSHKDLSEKWVQQVIVSNPEILGFGNVLVKNVELIQSSGGRLDILLETEDKQIRYEVELQLGATDPSHIIRTLEYWDLERNKNPKYGHIAVLIAEDVTARFLNVISLLNRTIPIILIQMKAVVVDDKMTLVFTRVLDASPSMYVEEEDAGPSTSRDDWLTKSTPTMLSVCDSVLEIIREVAPGAQLNYTKHYIGLAFDGLSNNRVIFKPKKQRLHFEVKIAQSEEMTARIEESGIEQLEYDHKYKQYRLSLLPEQAQSEASFLKELISESFGLSVVDPDLD